MNLLGLSIGKNSLLLGIFALITASILAATQAGTKDRIAASERAAAESALLEIIPADQHDNDLLTATQPVAERYWPLLGLKREDEIHIARIEGKATAVIVPAVAPDGYSGELRLIVGVYRNGQIAGVRVLAHNETPGLGDKVDIKKSDWVTGFNGKSLGYPPLEDWLVKKDGGKFDQFTGATITPRAVVKQVRKVLEFVQQAKPFDTNDRKADTAEQQAEVSSQ